MPKKIPHCNKCGHDHYNMFACGGKIETPTTQLRRPRIAEDGRTLDFGDRLDTLVAVSGDRVVGHKRRPIHSEMS